MKKLFVSLLLVVTNAVYALPAMPSSGTCAFLITQPVPFGISSFPYSGTGFKFMGTLSFNNSTSGVMNGAFVNVTYTNQDSPQYEHSAILKNVPFKITSMTTAPLIAKGTVLFHLG